MKRQAIDSRTASSKGEKTGRQIVVFSSRLIIITAVALIVVGYLLMSGSASTGQYFNPDIYSTRRIVIAPMLCLTGYLLIVVGILRKK